ncbi:ribose-5-phosphate isomerase RpiA [Flavihumibacter sp. ZG627]|uniref:ribose-5-phosphate isomerase RpiA n=1 Tax=Flavihumibacter sp. ZG627 TaxID=1463156 RepID=UPI000AE68A16|nr:ribose-5-phosphate isomerase RpiA [Flavihumibacter sp. ZG627]
MINPKHKAAQEAASYVKSGMIIGVGTGSTTAYFIQELVKLFQQGIDFATIPTSKATAVILQQFELPVLSMEEVSTIDLTVDGADEIDKELQLIKGGGGALLQEKMVAFVSKKYIIIADESKCVEQLGHYPLPVEVIPFGYKAVKMVIENTYGIKVVMRMKDGQPFITDHGHYILDCHFKRIDDAPSLHSHLNNITGVVDNGLFLNMADAAIIGQSDGKVFTVSI